VGFLAWEVLLAAALVRILIADNSMPWRRFLHTLVQHYPTWQVVAETLDGLDTIEKARDLQPDLIFLDIGLPGLNGIEAARKIKKASPMIKIVFLSAHTHPVIVQAAFNAGGLGYVTKTDAWQDLPMAVEALIAGRKFISPRLRTPSPDDSA
jgi:DNA-binding NarL/FixJ family response regulator